MIDSNIRQLQELLKAWQEVNNLLEKADDFNMLLAATAQAVGTQICEGTFYFDASPILELREQIAQSMMRVYEEERLSNK